MQHKTDAPGWWPRPRKITVCVDTPGWFDPFSQMLVATLNASGDDARLVRGTDEIAPGDIAFYLSCLRLTPTEVLMRNRQNIVVHGSALPHGRGFSPVVWQVLEGCQTIPLSMLVAEETADSGAILMRDAVALEGTELNGEIREKLGLKIVDMCVRYLALPAPSAGEEQQGDTTWYKRRGPDDSALDVARPICEQFDLLRVVDNVRYPAFFDYRGVRYILKIERDSRQSRDKENDHPK